MKKTNKKSDLWPILLGVLVVAAIAGVVIFFSIQSKTPVKKDRVQAADDGVLKDYEKEGIITLGDYSDVSGLATKEDLSTENTDDPNDLLWENYLATCKISSYPKELVTEAKEDLETQYVGFAEASGMSYEEVMESYGFDDASIDESAKDEVFGRLVAKTIANRENLTITDDKYRSALIELDGWDDKTSAVAEVEKNYIETSSVRPHDDVYVVLVKEFLMEKWKV